MAVMVCGKHRQFTITVHQDHIGFTCSEPDPAWLFVDDEGHKHRWVLIKKIWQIPTTEYYETRQWSFDDDTGEPYVWYAGAYRCKLCRQDIVGGTRRTEETMPGITEWSGSFVCTEEEAAALTEAMTTGVVEIGDWNAEGWHGTAIVTATSWDSGVWTVAFCGQGDLVYSLDTPAPSA